MYTSSDNKHNNEKKRRKKERKKTHTKTNNNKIWLLYHAVGDGAAQPGHAEALQRVLAGQSGIPRDHAGAVVNHVLVKDDIKALV